MSSLGKEFDCRVYRLGAAEVRLPKFVNRYGVVGERVKWLERVKIRWEIRKGIFCSVVFWEWNENICQILWAFFHFQEFICRVVGFKRWRLSSRTDQWTKKKIWHHHFRPKPVQRCESEANNNRILGSVYLPGYATAYKNEFFHDWWAWQKENINFNLPSCHTTWNWKREIFFLKK